MNRQTFTLRSPLCLAVLALVTVGLLASIGMPAQAQRRGPTRPTKTPTAPAPAPTPAPLPVIEKMGPTPAEVARGSALVFHGQNFPANPNDISISLNGEGKWAASLVNPEKTMFVFAVPSDIGLGRYRVQVKFKDVPFATPVPPDGIVVVYSEAGKAQPKITALVPLVSYPDKELYGFDVIGDGFSTRTSDLGLIVNQADVPVCWDADCKPEQTKGAVVNDHQLRFERIPARYKGGNKLQVRVGQNYSAAVDLTLAQVTANIPKYYAIGAVVLLFGLVFGVLSGFRNVIGGRKFSILSALFLDAETDTYSLSRLQFFIWTTVAILTYLYLLISRSLVQGKLEFVDVPTGLPSIVLMSAGTTVLAQAITNSKGPKGAGGVHPSLTDLVSTGGVIVPERFQFFVWTLIGAAVFVFLVFQHDPGTIADLPAIPNGFLALMGVSSAGYLGGKVARSAGPVIDEIVTRMSSLEFAIKGRVLSKDASFRINEEDVASDLIEHLKPQIVETDEQGGPSTAKLLRLKILTPKPEWMKDGTTLTIINPDGQKAAWKYDVGPAVTEPLQAELLEDDTVLHLVVKGINLGPSTKANVENRGGAPLALPITTEFPDPNTIEITAHVPSGQIRSGELILTNPDQRSVRIPFQAQ
jgi:hypothetical protein